MSCQHLIEFLSCHDIQQDLANADDAVIADREMLIAHCQCRDTKFCSDRCQSVVADNDKVCFHAVEDRIQLERLCLADGEMRDLPEIARIRSQIASLNNQIKNIIALNKKARERKAQRLFVVEGIRAVLEVPGELLSAVYYIEGFAASVEGKEFINDIIEKAPAASIEEVTANVFKSMCDTVTPQGVLAVVKMQDFSLQDVLGISSKKTAHVVILETLQDPGNMGTIIRTAEGAGATGIIINSTSVDLYSPKVVRSTMGSIFRITNPL